MQCHMTHEYFLTMHGNRFESTVTFDSQAAKPSGWQRPSLPVVLVYHHDMRRTKRVEVVIRFLRDAFRAWVQNDLPIIS